MTSTAGERKSALLLASLAAADRRALLASLPKDRGRRLNALIRELGAMPPEAKRLARELVEQHVPGSVDRHLDLEQLEALSSVLPVEWFVRVLAAWPGIDRSFVLELLETPRQHEARTSLAAIGVLPAKLAEALRSAAFEVVGSARGRA